MKRTSVLLCACFLLVAFFSCKKEKAAVPATPTIVGKWYIKKVTSSVFDNDLQTANYNETNFTTADFIRFNADGTGDISKSDTSSGSDNGNIFSYTVAGTNLFIAEYYPNATTVRDTVTITTLSETNLTWHNVSVFNNGSDIEKIIEDDYLSK